MLKRHRSTVESSIPHDVVELILETLPLKSMLRFKSVSNKWKFTVESPIFKERQLIRRRLSRGSDVLFVSGNYPFALDGDARTFVFGSSIVSTARFRNLGSRICRGSCDGLVCLYNVYAPPNAVANPATGWHKVFPLSTIQQFVGMAANRNLAANRNFSSPFSYLGFGKDKFRGTYKPVWLYNSSEFGLENATTCEVFDFSTNAWRYLLPASPYRILEFQEPVHFDGSLYWLTEGEETKVLSFDLHMETFQVHSKAPFPHAPDPHDVVLCILDDRLCISQKNWPNQVIWWFDSSSGTWKEMCSIDLTKTLSWFDFGKEPMYVLAPIAILEKNKLLLQGRDYFEPVMIHDLDTKSLDLLFNPINPVGPVSYFESLLTV